MDGKDKTIFFVCGMVHNTGIRSSSFVSVRKPFLQKVVLTQLATAYVSVEAIYTLVYLLRDKISKYLSANTLLLLGQK
jgi:hypothetical protein